MNKAVVTGFGASGEGVASRDGYRLFIDGALPGEEVLYVETVSKKTYAKAQTLKIISPSTERRNPPCPYYNECGGCQLQHLSYEGQLNFKQEKVRQALLRVGKLKNPQVEPTVSSPHELYYRNKIQLPVVGETIGLYKKGSHELIDIEACLLHSPIGEEVYKLIRPLLKNSGLRALLLKSTVSSSQVLVTLVAKKRLKAFGALAKNIMQTHSAVAGVVLCLNNKQGNALLGSHFELLEGSERITEELLGIKFSLSSASFFQVNPFQAEALYKKALEISNLSGTEFVVDAYCGVGTLSLIFANAAKKVLGIECVAPAIEDARQNAATNKIDNTEFKVGFAEKELPKLKNIDLLLLNPPRKGVDGGVITSIAKSMPKKVLYISCDPATLARDAKRLTELGYKPSSFIPFDMFPQTSHVETLVLFTK